MAVRAQSTEPETASPPEEAGPFDTRIDALRTTIQELKDGAALLPWTQPDLETLREAYVQLVIELFLYSNEEADAGKTVSQSLVLDEARTVATECIRTPELRQTRPVYPDCPREVEAVFAQVRLANIGGFVIDSLEPVEAVVLLGVDTLRAEPGTKLADTDLIAGDYSVFITADGYRDLVDQVTIQPAQETLKSYELSKGRNWWYWTGAGLIAGGLVAVLWAAIDDPPLPPEETDPVLDPPPNPPGVRSP